MDIEALRKSYQPDQIKALFIGESPPASGKFFYCEGAMTAYTARAFEMVFDRAFPDTTSFLKFFQVKGCYLDDICLTPVDKLPPKQRRFMLNDSVAPFALRLAEYNAEIIIVVLKRILPYVERAVSMANVISLVYSLPFPGFGHQKKYIEGLSEILQRHLK